MHIPGGQVAQFPGADRCQDRCQDVLVLLDRLGGPAAEPVPQPVFGCAPDRVALVCLEAGLEFLVVWVPTISSTSPDQAIFVDRAIGASPPPDAVLPENDRLW